LNTEAAHGDACALTLEISTSADKTQINILFN